MELLRPTLALRAFDIAHEALQAQWVAENEAYVRERVLARAHEDLTPSSIEEDACRALKRALGRHENLLSGYEHARARAWAKHLDAEELRELLLDFLHGEDSLLERARRFLSAGESIDLGKNRVASINETVASYLLAMAHPELYAFAKPESAFQPAYRLLVSTDGARLPTGPERLVLVTSFYMSLRDLWSQEREFEGDLLDVHSHLFLLGSGRGAYAPFSWARAVSVEDVAYFVSRSDDGKQWFEPFERAGEQMREICFDSNRLEDPFHGLELEDYAHVYGGAARTLAWISEYGSRDLARLQLDSADAFGISMGSDGAWRIQGEDGATREEAQAFFETRIKPRLKELTQVARVMMDRSDAVELEYLSTEHYRSLDGKLLLLLLCAYDPVWAHRFSAPVTRAIEIVRLAELLSLEIPAITSFTDYLAAQSAITSAMGSSEGETCAVGSLVMWTREDPLGRMLVAYLDVADEDGEVERTIAEQEREADRIEQEREEGEAPGEREEIPSPEVAARFSRDAWDSFIETLSNPRQERLARLLRARKNVVLYGPPGTGKTVLSTRLGVAWGRWQADEHHDAPSVEQVTFHPSYGYEEFVEGFRPVPERPGEFELRDGLLVKLAERAERAPERQFLLLIDELNRGDVARIFGELITLIEADKRSPEHARRRMLSQRSFWMPPNLHVLATMNTADKSISLLDVAVRRRFAFEQVAPEPGLLDREPGLVREVQGVYLSALLEAFNTRLSQIGIYPERWLGHSFLWIDERDVEDPLLALSRRIRLDIIPLIEEYCYSDRRQMREVLGELVDRQGQPNDALLESNRLVGALRELIEQVEREGEDPT